jgi:tetratricopeptide (TPR) repeat protein
VEPRLGLSYLTMSLILYSDIMNRCVLTLHFALRHIFQHFIGYSGCIATGCLFVLWLFSFECIAQTRQIDSLKVLEYRAIGIEKKKLQIEIARAFGPISLVETYEWADKSLAELPYDTFLTIKANRIKGQALNFQQRTREALIPLSIARDLGKDRKVCREALVVANNWASANVLLGNWRDALYEYYRLQKLLQLYPDVEVESSMFNNMGLLYFKMNNPTLALHYLLKGHHSNVLNGEHHQEIGHMTNIALCYAHIGNFPESIAYLERIRSNGRPTWESEAIPIAFTEAVLYDKIGLIAEAEATYKKTIRLCDHFGDNRMKADALLEIAKLHLGLKKYDVAIRELNECREICLRLGWKQTLLDAYYVYLTFFRSSNDWPSYSQIASKYTELYDELYESRIGIDLAFQEAKWLEVKHRNAIDIQKALIEKEAQSLNLQAQISQLAMLLIAASTIAVILCLYSIRQVRSKRERLQIVADERYHRLKRERGVSDKLFTNFVTSSNVTVNKSLWL